jgi:DNA topoisomerase-3
MEGVLKTPCPACGGELHEGANVFQCVRCTFSIWKMIAGRLFEAEDIEKLICERQLGPIEGFRSKTSGFFTAMLKLDSENKLVFDISHVH